MTGELAKQVMTAIHNMTRVYACAWPVIAQDAELLPMWTEVLVNLQDLQGRLQAHAQEGIALGQDAIACADRGRAFMDALAENVQKMGSPKDGTAGGT